MAGTLPLPVWRSAGLAAATLASPFILFAVDRGLLAFVAANAPGLVDPVLARPASFAACGLLFLLLVGSRSLLPVQPWSRARGPTLCVCLVAAAVAAGGVALGATGPVLPGTALIGFLALGLMAEEWLFRGVVFETFLRLTRWGSAGAVWGSAFLFAVSHFGYHSFQPTPAAWAQVGFTFVMGLALGWLRLRSGRIIPGALAHLSINAAGLMATAILT
jgi:membrane protease YdiL (CAAX protease family)